MSKRRHTPSKKSIAILKASLEKAKNGRTDTSKNTDKRS